MATLKRLNKETGTYEIIPVGGGVPEAPVDDKPYVRKDGEWVNMYNQYENEDIAILIMDIMDRDTNTVTQEEYDKFAAICPVGKIAYAHLSDEAMGNTTVEIGMNGIAFKMYNDDGNIIILSNNNYSTYTGHYSFTLLINSDLSYFLQSGYGYIIPGTDEDTGEHYINIVDEIVAQGPDGNEQVGGSATLISGGDGTKFLSNSGEYKTVSPFANQEYADIIVSASNSGSISSDDYNKLSELEVSENGHFLYAETVSDGSLVTMSIRNTGTCIEAHIRNIVQSELVTLMAIGFILEINPNLTVDIKEENSIYLDNSGDGTSFLANNGQYVEIDTSNFATKNELEGKQNTISDLETIRSNAEKGKQALESLPTNLSQLTSDETHRTVTDSEKSTWNSKSDFSGSFSDLTNIPAKITNLRSYTTASTVASLNVNYESIYVTLTANASLSASATGADYNGRTITAYVYTSGARTITIPTTGNYVSMCGSSFTTTANGWVEFNLTCIDGKWHIAKLEQEESLSTNPT